jgi:peptidoglycan/xylan/chitin deacetylase (PgdA/CDA1 family)
MGLIAPSRPVMPSARSPIGGLALTFDDGPDPRGTPAVLDALDRAGASVTFFVIAPSAERHPDLLARAVACGHRIALHCDRHVRHTELDERAVGQDTERALERLARLGVRPTLWRVPWGVCTDATAKVAARFDLTLIGWDVDTHDWRGDGAEEMFSCTRVGLAAGAVVLAHDGVGPGARRADCAQTAEYVTLVADHSGRSDLTLAAL